MFHKKNITAVIFSYILTPLKDGSKKLTRGNPTSTTQNVIVHWQMSVLYEQVKRVNIDINVGQGTE